MFLFLEAALLLDVTAFLGAVVFGVDFLLFLGIDFLAVTVRVLMAMLW